MKLRGLVLALALLVTPSLAHADPIVLSGGAWTSVSTSLASDSELGAVVAPFWSGLSWDCATCNVGFLINAYGAENVQYLHNGFGGAVNFRFEEDITDPVYFGGITAWTNGVFGRRADGAFTYATDYDLAYNSWENGVQFALFRVVTAEGVHYYLGIEDIPVSWVPNDHDHNDYITTFTQVASVPEPSSLLLMGLAGLGLAARKRIRK